MNTSERARSTTLAALLTPVAVGLIYVGVSCERYNTGAGKCESQWVTALAISGMGGAWSAGFWQPNPALRERERRQQYGELDVQGVDTAPPDDLPPHRDSTTPPEPLGMGLGTYTRPELALLTVEQLRALARQAGLREVARKGLRADLVGALLNTQRVKG